jgi:hypothetical protein
LKGAYCLHHHPDGGGSTHLWNVRQINCDYTALHGRRLNFLLAAVRTWNLTKNQATRRRTKCW